MSTINKFIVSSLLMLLVSNVVFATNMNEMKKSAQCVNLENMDKDPISLFGTLHGVTCWGPPNFGEDPKTDRKFSAYVLFLDAPLLICKGSLSKKSKLVAVRHLQIYIDPKKFKKIDVNALVGKRIAVSGLIDEPTGVGEVITRLVMDNPLSIKIIEKECIQINSSEINTLLQKRGCALAGYALPSTASVPDFID